MSNTYNNPETAAAAPKRTALVGKRQAKKAAKKKKRASMFWCIVRRTLLVFFTLILVVFAAFVLLCHTIFNGPSVNARNRLTMSMRESSGMKWFPQIFIGADTVAEIEKASNYELPDELSDYSQININLDSNLSGGDAWADAVDGIRLEKIKGDTFNAYVMLIRDPSRVYLATSTDKFARHIPGERINDQMEKEGAVAAINAGAFYDNGTSSKEVGSTPEDLTIAGGKVVWKTGSAPEEGFAGFNHDRGQGHGAGHPGRLLLRPRADYERRDQRGSLQCKLRSEPPYCHRSVRRRYRDLPVHRWPSGQLSGRHLCQCHRHYDRVRRGECLQPGRRFFHRDVPAGL